MTEQNTQLVLERNDWIVSLIRAAKGFPLDVDTETLPDHVRQGVELIQQLFTRANSSEWRMMSGDWREELVSLHDDNGHIVSGLTVSQARALIDAHGVTRPSAKACAIVMQNIHCKDPAGVSTLIENAIDQLRPSNPIGDKHDI